MNFHIANVILLPIIKRTLDNWSATIVHSSQCKLLAEKQKSNRNRLVIAHLWKVFPISWLQKTLGVNKRVCALLCKISTMLCWAFDAPTVGKCSCPHKVNYTDRSENILLSHFRARKSRALSENCSRSRK